MQDLIDRYWKQRQVLDGAAEMPPRLAYRAKPPKVNEAGITPEMQQLLRKQALQARPAHGTVQ
jgi:hypothetical protein